MENAAVAQLSRSTGKSAARSSFVLQGRDGNSFCVPAGKDRSGLQSAQCTLRYTQAIFRKIDEVMEKGNMRSCAFERIVAENDKLAAIFTFERRRGRRVF